MTEPNRTEYIKGLHALAYLLDEHPEIPLPNEATNGRGHWFFFETKEEIAALARAVPGRKEKTVTDGSYGFELTGRLYGLRFTACVDREEVCTGVVTGTRTEIRRKATAWEEVGTEVPEVEWRCSPLLAEAGVE